MQFEPRFLDDKWLLAGPCKDSSLRLTTGEAFSRSQIDILVIVVAIKECSLGSGVLDY